MEIRTADLKTIGRRLAVARKTKGLTIEEASRLSGVPQASIGSYEHARRAMSVSALVLLLNAYGTDANYILGTTPQSYMDDNGDYTGFDLELAEAVCEIEGWELVKTPIDWDSKDMELNSGNIDCIWNGFTMDGREDSYSFSVPYVDNSQVICVADDSGITTLADLEGKIVGVQADSAALALLEEDGDQADLGATFAELQQFADYNTAFAELQAGSLDAVAIDVGVAQYQIKGREGYSILDEALNSEKYAVGFKKGNEDLVDTINDDLAILLDDGTFEELAEKYEIADMVCLEESLGFDLGDDFEVETETE